MSFRGMMTYPNWAARSPWFMILTIASEIEMKSRTSWSSRTAIRTLSMASPV